MRYSEILEQVYYQGDFKGLHDVNSVDIKILKNPSKREIDAMVKNSLGNPRELRGLLSDDALYIWDAYFASHDSIRRVFELSGEHVYFYNGYFKIDDYNWRHPDIKADALENIQTNGVLNRLYPNIRFVEDAERGFIFTY